MKILALADTHGLLPQLDTKGIDFIAIAGDVCPMSNHSPAFQKTWLESSFYRWVEKLEKPVYLCLGNHDFVDDFKAPPNLFYHTQQVIDDVLLFSFTPEYGNWAWMATEKEMEEKLSALLSASRPSVWITHGPPCMAGDLVPGPRGSCHVGSTALRSAIEHYRPKVVICGHIHTGQGKFKIGGSTVYNVTLPEDYAFGIDEDGILPPPAKIIEI